MEKQLSFFERITKSDLIKHLRENLTRLWREIFDDWLTSVAGIIFVPILALVLLIAYRLA